MKISWWHILVDILNQGKRMGTISIQQDCKLLVGELKATRYGGGRRDAIRRKTTRYAAAAAVWFVDWQASSCTHSSFAGWRRLAWLLPVETRTYWRVVGCLVRGRSVCVKANKFILCNQVEYFRSTLIEVTVFPVIIRESEYIYKKIFVRFKRNSVMNAVLWWRMVFAFWIAVCFSMRYREKHFCVPLCVHIPCAERFKIRCLCIKVWNKNEQAVFEKLNRIAGVTPAPAMYWNSNRLVCLLRAVHTLRFFYVTFLTVQINEVKCASTRFWHFTWIILRWFKQAAFIICLFTLTLRRLMSYIYGAPILDVSRSHTTTHHSR